MLARFAGGWLMVQRIRQTAVPVRDHVTAETLGRVKARVAPQFPVALLASPHVETPVVVGARRPALILPTDLADQLDARALEPLLAHECEHIRRRDYAVNLAQWVLDAALFFSPGVRWVSRVVRETRKLSAR